MPLNARSLQLLTAIHPALAKKAEQLAEMMELAGHPIQIVQGLRSWVQQADLYAQGRTKPGPIVTKAPPGHSWHEFGLAIDIVPQELLTTPGWEPDSPIWPDLGAKGKSLGLFWGGDFQSIPDRPHFQLTGSWPESPTDETRQTFLDGGMVAVWQQGGLEEVNA